MKIKRALSILWVIGLFLLLFVGIFMLNHGVDALRQADFRIHPVYTQSK